MLHLVDVLRELLESAFGCYCLHSGRIEIVGLPEIPASPLAVSPADERRSVSRRRVLYAVGVWRLTDTFVEEMKTRPKMRTNIILQNGRIFGEPTIPTNSSVVPFGMVGWFETRTFRHCPHHRHRSPEQILA